MASPTLDQAISLIRERIRELDDEKAKLERALADLTGGSQGRRGPGRPRGSSNSTSTSGRTRRPGRRSRRGGTRSEHALDLIKSNPGISAGEIAKQLGIAPNYMYRVMSDLVKDGQVTKKGRGYSVKS